MKKQGGASGSGAQEAVAISDVLILHHDTTRIAIARPAVLEDALEDAEEYFPNLRTPLRLTRNLPQHGGDVQITESAWETFLIQDERILVLDVHESTIEVEEVASKEGTDGREDEQSGESGDEESEEQDEEKDMENEGQRKKRKLMNEKAESTSDGDKRLDLPHVPRASVCRSTQTLNGDPNIVVVKVLFRRSEILDKVFTFTFHEKLDGIYARMANEYGVDEVGLRGNLRFQLDDGEFISDSTAGEALDDGPLGTEGDPLKLDVLVAAGPPVSFEDYYRCQATGEKLPTYRDELARLLKPLPTDPYLP